MTRAATWAALLALTLASGVSAQSDPREPDANADGLVDIASIGPGDEVWALDEATGQWGYQAVTERTVHASDGVFALVVGPDDGPYETIEATAEHPFWARPGWTPAGELRPGDEVFTSTGGWIRVHGNTWIAREQLVYNLDVEGADTFFVGESGAWVHNACGPHAPDQRALRALLNDATAGGRNPLSVSEAETVLDWADEVGTPYRAGARDVTGTHGGTGYFDTRPHIHVDGLHWLVDPGVRPR